MTITTKIKRGEWYQGEDRSFVFRLDIGVAEDPSTWEFEFVVRRPSATCPGRGDPGDGSIVLSKTTDITTAQAADGVWQVTVPVERADTLDLTPDDYYAALWRTDDGDDRPLSVLLYAHLTAVARQS